MTLNEGSIDRAAEAIASADALFIGAGAGMGVDSGLPDFCGPEGFWKAYPLIAKLGLHFEEMANPHWFAEDPELAWGFYGHRLNLYRVTKPHAGFAILLRWAEQMNRGAFVFTSNVDGHFQRACFADNAVLECHGSIHHLQCTAGCGQEIWLANDLEIKVDEATLRAEAPLPTCPSCDMLARPNILMFGDWGWNSSRTDGQTDHFSLWLEKRGAVPLAVVEIGAGKAVPTVRMRCEEVAGSLDASFIRINLRDFDAPSGAIPLRLGGLEALRSIDEILFS